MITTEKFPEIFDLIKSGLDNIDQGITIFDENLDLVFANNRILDLLDFPAEIIEPGCNFERLIKYNCDRGEYGPGDREQQLKERLDEAKKFKAHTIERTRPDGTILRISGSPLTGGGFATIYTDITKDRLNELRLEQRIDEQTINIRRGEERLRLIANEVPAGIAYLDQNEVFQFANRRFASAYGQTPDSIIGQKCSDILSSSVYSISKEFFDSVKTGQDSDFDHEYVNQDGRILHIRTYLRADIGERKNVNGFYILSINVTRHKTAAAALSEAQKMEAIGRLSSGIAHDFNNMLTVILGNLKPLNDIEKNNPAKQEMIQPAIRAALNGADLTKQLLTVARRQSLTPKPVNISEMITNLNKLIASSLKNNIQFEIDIPKEEVWTFADPSPLENTLVNLIFNANDAIENKGRIIVKLTLNEDNESKNINHNDLLSEVDSNIIQVSQSDHIQICIQDDGCGIKKEIIKKIFDPFFSTKLKQNGSGLGLAMAQSFVEKSYGSLEVKSELDKGSQFIIRLPRIDVIKPIQQQISPTKLKNGNDELALVVDDHDDVRKTVRFNLMELGFKVIEAQNADEALSLIEQVDMITTVVSDIDMPGNLNGVDLIKKIQSSYPHIRTVLMTGHGNLNAQQLQNEINNCMILNKPFPRQVLANAIFNA